MSSWGCGTLHLPLSSKSECQIGADESVWTVVASDDQPSQSLCSHFVRHHDEPATYIVLYGPRVFKVRTCFLFYFLYLSCLHPSVPPQPNPFLNITPPHLRLPELLSAELVSKKWLAMCRQDELYELLVRRLTKDDPVPIREPDPSQEGGGWRMLYHALHHRERNWAWGNPQSIK